MLAVALELEADLHLATLAAEIAEQGRRLVTRNGHARPGPSRPWPVRSMAPRSRDRRVDPPNRRFLEGVRRTSLGSPPPGTSPHGPGCAPATTSWRASEEDPERSAPFAGRGKPISIGWPASAFADIKACPAP